MKRWAIAVMLLNACTSPGGSIPAEPPDAVPRGRLAPPVRAQAAAIERDLLFLLEADLPSLGRAGDLRIGWWLVDLLRFHQGTPAQAELLDALTALTGIRIDPDRAIAWVGYTDILLRWDVPAPPGYLALKRAIFVELGDRTWRAFFDPAANLDWREVTSGGVRRDGIEALEDPPMVTGARGSWLPDDDIVFGVVVDGKAAAFPRRIMAVHELVNARVGGRAISLPYCTLCGIPAAYFADDQGARRLRFRTSGLLQRSNKLMYEPRTESLFDQADGRALTGPLRRRAVRLTPLDVTTTTWGEWRAAYPSTTIVRRDAGTGRTYEADPLRGRDDDGPIFPVGAIDERLPAMELVYGVIARDGTAVAFPVERARAALRAGDDVALRDVRLGIRGGGLITTGVDAPVGQTAFWFAWSQFHPAGLLWPADA